MTDKKNIHENIDLKTKKPVNIKRMRFKCGDDGEWFYGTLKDDFLLCLDFGDHPRYKSNYKKGEFQSYSAISKESKDELLSVGRCYIPASLGDPSFTMELEHRSLYVNVYQMLEHKSATDMEESDDINDLIYKSLKEFTLITIDFSQIEEVSVQFMARLVGNLLWDYNLLFIDHFIRVKGLSEYDFNWKYIKMLESARSNINREKERERLEEEKLKREKMGEK